VTDRIQSFPAVPPAMIAEALRTLPQIDDPYSFPARATSGKDEEFRLYTVQRGKKVYYSGTPLPDWDGTELEEPA